MYSVLSFPAGGEATEGRRRRGSRDSKWPIACVSADTVRAISSPFLAGTHTLTVSSNEEDDDEDEIQSKTEDCADDEDIGSQTTEIDIDDLFQSPIHQFDPHEIEIKSDEIMEENYPDNSHYSHTFYEPGDRYGMRHHVSYVGCTSKVSKMPDMNSEVDGDDELEPNSISDYDVSDDEPSPVMTSTDEDDSNDAVANGEVDVRDMQVRNPPGDFSGSDRDHDGNNTSSERGKYSVPIVAIPIVMKRWIENCKANKTTIVVLKICK